ncbi:MULTISPECIES: hypothetical protein [Pantoea]|nr:MULTISPECIES: hypothetical protein [Pantoea]TSH83582.1 hypothetical protein FOV68_09100 [Pantoea sp. paga]WNK65570.1 hypothetical protein RM156_11800 [Pantoea agglomerans]
MRWSERALLAACTVFMPGLFIFERRGIIASNSGRDVMNTEKVKAWLMVHANGTELVTQHKKHALTVAQLKFWTVYPLIPTAGSHVVNLRAQGQSKAPAMNDKC